MACPLAPDPRLQTPDLSTPGASPQVISASAAAVAACSVVLLLLLLLRLPPLLLPPLLLLPLLTGRMSSWAPPQCPAACRRGSPPRGSCRWCVCVQGGGRCSGSKRSGHVVGSSPSNKLEQANELPEVANLGYSPRSHHLPPLPSPQPTPPAAPPPAAPPPPPAPPHSLEAQDAEVGHTQRGRPLEQHLAAGRQQHQLVKQDEGAARRRLGEERREEEERIEVEIMGPFTDEVWTRKTERSFADIVSRNSTQPAPIHRP